MTKVAFLGTPEAAVPTMTGLAETFQLELVITQPDRPRGRSKEPKPSPVKVAATDLGIRVEQPETSNELREGLLSVDSLDVAIVVAYGRLIRPDALTVPLKGMLNVHFSLLPRWRGAAPVSRALIAGDTMTGVTIIKLNEGLDTGPVLNAQAIDIGHDETAGELTRRLADIGTRLLISTLPDYLSGQLSPVPQSDDGLTYAEKLTADDRRIDLASTATEIVNLVRGLAPEPGAVLLLDGEPHRVLAASVVDADGEPDSWVSHEDRPIVKAADGSVRIDMIQPPGRQVMDSADWLRGRRAPSGRVG